MIRASARDAAIAAPCIAALTALLLWPAFATGAPWSFADTASYYNGGAAAWAFLIDAVSPDAGIPDAVMPAATPEAGAALGTPSPDQGGSVRYGIRSVPYSMAVYATVQILGLWAPVVLMALATAGLLWLVARDVPALPRLVLCASLCALTALPFFASLFQPDVLTAALVLIPIAIMLHADRLGRWAIVALLALLAFATLTHYGNVPLAALALLWLGVWALRRRRRFLAAIVLVPVLAAAGVNVAIGIVLDTGPSLAPGRFPLPLARSIEDGPGYRYLTAACPEADYALCEVYDTIPDNVGAFLWGPNSISKRATPDQLARIGAEETALLIDILRYDPVGQARAFLGNAVEQFFLFGSAQDGLSATRSRGPSF